MRPFLDSVAVLWCRFAHDKITRPVGSYYCCLTCTRKYAVSWTDVIEPGVYGKAHVR